MKVVKRHGRDAAEEKDIRFEVERNRNPVSARRWMVFRQAAGLVPDRQRSEFFAAYIWLSPHGSEARRHQRKITAGKKFARACASIENQIATPIASRACGGGASTNGLFDLGLAAAR